VGSAVGSSMGSAVGASVDLKTSLSTHRGVAAGSRPPRQHRTPRETESQVFCFFCLHWAFWRPCLRVFVPQSLYQLFLRPCSQRQRAVPQSLQSLFQSPCWHWPVPQSLHWLLLLAPVVAAARGAVLAVALPEPVLALVRVAVFRGGDGARQGAPQKVKVAEDAVVAELLMESLGKPTPSRGMKAKEAEIFTCKVCNGKYTARRKRQWKRQQEELRVLQ
jgi:hypothetical protein